MIQCGTFTKDGKELDNEYSERKATMPFKRFNCSYHQQKEAIKIWPLSQTHSTSFHLE